MRGSRTPGSGSDRARKRRKGLLRRIKQGFNEKDKGLMLFIIGVTAFFGAGTVDVLFTDVVPMRPYSGLFVAVKKRRKWTPPTLTMIKEPSKEKPLAV